MNTHLSSSFSSSSSDLIEVGNELTNLSYQPCSIESKTLIEHAQERMEEEDVAWLEEETMYATERDAEKALASQFLSKLQKVHHQLGYREGQAKGYEDALQRNFDHGYAEGFQLGFLKGDLIGQIRMKYFFESLRHPPGETYRHDLNQFLHSISTQDRPLEDIQNEFLKFNQLEKEKRVDPCINEEGHPR
ncbi:hypothetical protein HMI55_003822 [Coelomomyces lativittatus]|nr:hypothetical protein HMI56_005348 [Coelomomyces lativittatus]KAJ1515314.1 hypothetical protein HMI55_003822 [Coelomomyces lativittatus]